MKTIFKALVGSQAYGTATPESDHDYKGVYLQPSHEILGFDYKPQIETNKDDVSYEIRRFLELAQSANPTILELLYMPKENIIVSTTEFHLVRALRAEFLTKMCKNSFAGYAVQQIQKADGLEKKGKWEKGRIERKEVKDFCYIVINGITIPLKEYISTYGFVEESLGLAKIDHARDLYALYSWGQGMKGIADENSNDVRVSSIPKDIEHRPIGLVTFNKDAYQVHCKEYKSYETWLKERNTARYVDYEKHGQYIDGKNMLHCVRLIDVATEIATTGEFNVKRPNADYLLSIRRGEVNLKDIVKESKEKLKGLDTLFDKSGLPDRVNPSVVKELLSEIRERQVFNEQHYG